MDSNDRCIQAYAKIIIEFPVLSATQEQDLFDIFTSFKSGKQKKAARDALINSNLSLVLKHAHRYNKASNIPLEVLVSAGIEGLCIAIDRFNPVAYKKLSTYATHWIKLKIIRVLNTFWTTVYVPGHIKDNSYKYQGIVDNDKNMTDKQLMKELNLSKKGLQKVKMARYISFSLEQEQNNSQQNDGSVMTIGSFIPDSKITTADKSMENKENKERLHKLLDMLTPIQKEVVVARYFSGDKVKLSDVGKKWKITGERVRQIEVKALNKMRRRLKSRSNFEIREI